jgi:hypothetical protein
MFENDGGAGRNRTDDLYNAIVALSQLSYSPGTIIQTSATRLERIAVSFITAVA